MVLNEVFPIDLKMVRACLWYTELDMWRSWSKFAFVNCDFELLNLFECKFESKRAQYNGWNQKMYCIMLTGFFGNQGPVVLLPKMMRLLLLLKHFILCIWNQS